MGKAAKTKTHSDGPKRPKSAFLYFSSERRLTLKQEKPSMTTSESGNIISAEWKTLTDEQKQRYNEMANKDRDRYNAERAAKAGS